MMQHIAKTLVLADNIDIRYAQLALAISDNSAVRNFAETMVRDHNSVNAQAFALLKELNAQPQANFLSASLQADANDTLDELSHLRGDDFDKQCAANELAYHEAVNDLVEHTFIPNIENKRVKDLFIAGLGVFKSHEVHAGMLGKQTQ